MFDFLKRKKKYDAEGFDADGYNRLGLDRMGYDRNGYDVDGFNRDGYDRHGINKYTGLDSDGYDRDGFNSEGWNRDGFNRDGYDHDGFDKEGYDRNGYNKAGMTRDGFNKYGYDLEGYNREGFDKEGYNRKGMDRDGYNREGFNGEGYNREGFDRFGFNHDGRDREGYDRNGYDINGFNHEGYDKDGYDKRGYNQAGYDRAGYDEHGYDIDGFDQEGYDAEGYDRYGFNSEGYNKDGYDRFGLNINGYDKDGYDKEGFDKNGFNRDGISKHGFKKEEFDEKGFHKITGFDVWGFNRYGFNVNGINRHTGRDRLGYDSDGYDTEGYNIWGFNPDTEEDRLGNSIQFYIDQGNFTEEKALQFEDTYYKFMAGKHELAANLANAYCYGKGTVKDYRKALRVLLDAAYEYSDMKAIKELSDYFYIGDVVRKNVEMALYLMDIVDSKKPKSINQYKAREALKFTKPANSSDNSYDKTFTEESNHLREVMYFIRSEIESTKGRIYDLDRDTSWMDRDQREDWLEKRYNNQILYKKIDELERIERKPYYGRMDIARGYGTEKIYIGETGFSDYHNIQISSVWSELGKHFRDTRNNFFSLNGRTVTVTLRRKFTIENGVLLDYYDEYDGNTEAGKAEITDAYLLHILAEKRGEKNITNIIRSIQANQNDIIEEDIQSNIIVQGCAGSGKTMILLHRLANLKYNNMNYDWNRVKIITPNHSFTLFIDDLSKDLRINDIEKLTLEEYYISLLTQYWEQKLDQTEKNGVRRLVKSSHYNESNELKRIRKDKEWEKEIVEYVYSFSFKKAISDYIISLENRNQRAGFTQALEAFYASFKDILGYQFKIIRNVKSIPNYTCVLYAKVLFMYLYFGKVRNNVKLLCIDEGQDICESQYVLIYEANGKSTHLNIFGDLAQRIADNVSLSDWKALMRMMPAEYFELNENYRNSEEIIEYYNKCLGTKNKSFGLSTKPVEQFEERDLDILVKYQLLLKNRTVIITKAKDRIPQSVLSLCIPGGVAEDYISVMNVLEVKGLEFDTAFVFDEDMDWNEKYISYTRALSELYVKSSKNTVSLALGIGNDFINVKKNGHL